MQQKPNGALIWIFNLLLNTSILQHNKYKSKTMLEAGGFESRSV